MKWTFKTASTTQSRTFFLSHLPHLFPTPPPPVTGSSTSHIYCLWRYNMPYINIIKEIYVRRFGSHVVWIYSSPPLLVCGPVLPSSLSLSLSSYFYSLSIFSLFLGSQQRQQSKTLFQSSVWLSFLFVILSSFACDDLFLRTPLESNIIGYWNQLC